MKKPFIKKVVTLFCCLVILFSGIYTSPVLPVNAASTETFIYTFEADQDPVATNSMDANSVNMTRAGDGKGVMGWTWGITSSNDASHNKILRTFNYGMNQSWATSGGYRINDKKRHLPSCRFYNLCCNYGY